MAFKCTRPTAEIFYGLSVFTFAFNAIVMPQLVQHKVCYNKYNSSICSNLYKHKDIENEVQANAAQWMSVLPLSSLIPALFMILMIGPISDLIGKRKTMVVPPLVYFIQSVVFILMTRVKKPFSPGFFILPYCLSGLFGDNAGCASLAEAYISCITLARNRTIRMAILESAIYFGTIAAGFSSGFLLMGFGFTAAYCATATVNFINLMYVLFALPSEKSLLPEPPQTTERRASKEACEESESESTHSRLHGVQEREIRSESPLKATEILNPWKCLVRIRNAICVRDRLKKLIATLSLFAIALFVNMGEIYFGILFIKHSPFNFKAKDIGYIVVVQSTLRAAGVLIIPYLCQRFLKFKDIHIVILGFTVQTVYFTAFGLTSSALALYLLQIIGIPLAVHQPVFRSMISKLVDPDQYGAAIAAAEAVDLASSLLTSLVSNQIYSETVSIFRGFTMCLLGLLAFIGLIGATIFNFSWRKEIGESLETQYLLKPESK